MNISDMSCTIFFSTEFFVVLTKRQMHFLFWQCCCCTYISPDMTITIVFPSKSFTTIGAFKWLFSSMCKNVFGYILSSNRCLWAIGTHITWWTKFDGFILQWIYKTMYYLKKYKTCNKILILKHSSRKSIHFTT